MTGTNVHGSHDRKLFAVDGSHLVAIYWAGYGGVKIFRGDESGCIRDWTCLFYDRFTNDQETAVRHFLRGDR